MQKNRIREFFSLKGVFTPKNTVVMGVLVALAIVLDQFSIYITPTFQAITFSYLPGVVVAVLFGPWAAVLFGFVADTAKFFLNPHGGYFPGYVISEMVSYFTYACFLYKTTPKIWKVACARVFILISVTMGLNFFWNVIMYGSVASKYFTSVRLINNLVQLPVHVALIMLMLKYLRKIPQFKNRLM